MRSISIIVIVLVLIFVSGYVMSIYISNSSKMVDEQLVKLDSEVRKNNWSSALDALQNLENKWTSIKSGWAMLVDHQEIDNIDLSVSKMKEFVKEKDTVDALAEISSLRLLFEHIPQKESLTFTNIL